MMMQLISEQQIVTGSRIHPRSDDDCCKSLFDNMERPKKRVRFSSVAETHLFSYDNNHHRTASPAIEGDNAVTTAEESDNSNNIQHAPTEQNTPLTEAEIRRSQYRSWLSRRDLAYFRSCAKKMCKSITNNLDNALHQAYDDSHETTEADFGKSLALLENDDYSKQRGLERWSSRNHALFRSSKIIEVKTAVLLEQSVQMLQGETDAERLAMIAQAASLKSQRFAQVLALADATLAMQVQEGGRAA